MVVVTCMESSVLYDFHTRIWYKRELKEEQKSIDNCYRYVWRPEIGQPLRQMSDCGVNTVNMRERFGVHSVA